MCGIVATFNNNRASQFIVDGLEAVEYRGYDSAGLAVINQKQITCLKVVGSVANLQQKLDNNQLTGSIGIGHTRWATHGRVTLKNTHPHCDHNEEFYVVHNGIIENYVSLKKFLIEKGVKFKSQTDSEVIAQLLAYNYQQHKDVRRALIDSLQTLKGAYALAVISTLEPDKLWGAKLSGPLIFGIGDNKTYYLSSDNAALIDQADKIIRLEDYELIEISDQGYTISNLQSEKIINRRAEIIKFNKQEQQLGDFTDYMSKEIHHTPQAIEDAMRGRLLPEDQLITLGGLDAVHNRLQSIDRIIIVGCGTSYFAGMVGEYLIEEIADIPVEVQLASEFKYRQQPLSRNDVAIFISQSGETADTIGAIETIEDTGILKLGIVNVAGSTISRLTDAGIYCRAGIEKSVASTKAFSTQVTILILVALYLSHDYTHFNTMIKQLANIPQILDKFLKTQTLEQIAQKYAKYKNFLFLGRQYNYPVAFEGALKLKEISYIHAEALATGEVKHGTLSLIDANFPTFIFALSGTTLEKTISNIAEIKARKGKVIALIDDPQSELINQVDDFILVDKIIEPLQPLLAGTVCHLFAYHVAKTLKRPIDRPRNLAKSVTVE